MNTSKWTYLKKVSFVLPLFFFTGVFIVYPFVSSLYYSLTRWDGISPPTFIGLTNYFRLFKESNFREIFFNTILYTLVNLLLVNPLSLLMALLLNSKIKGKTAFRTIFYLPVVLSGTVVSYLWGLILANEGILNQIMLLFGSQESVDWLGNVDTAKWILIIILIWQGIGTGLVFYLAGLQGIPAELYESAAIDGVTPWSKFKCITLPLLMPTVTIVTFFGLGGTLKLFDLPYIMTKGGPGVETTTLAVNIYKQAFLNSNYGYATAIGILLFLLILVVSLLQLKITRSKEEEI